MRRSTLAVLGLSGLTACTLITSLDGLTGGPEDGASVDGASGDAGADGPGKPVDSGGPAFDAAACTAVPCVVQLAAVGSFTCALLVDHTVRCWGRNTSGELGYGTLLPDGGWKEPPSTQKPVTIPGVAADEIAVGCWSRYDGFACARSGGTVSCWGNDKDHQLARGNYGAGAGPHAVVQAAPVTGLPAPATAIFAGATHACAVATGAV
jgi:hypothetical protein